MTFNEPLLGSTEVTPVTPSRWEWWRFATGYMIIAPFAATKIRHFDIKNSRSREAHSSPIITQSNGIYFPLPSRRANNFLPQSFPGCPARGPSRPSSVYHNRRCKEWFLFGTLPRSHSHHHHHQSYSRSDGPLGNVGGGGVDDRSRSVYG